LGRSGRMAEVPGGIERLRDEWEKYLNYVSTLIATTDTEQQAKQPPTMAI